MKKMEAWKTVIYDLEKISLERYKKPSNFRKLIIVSLHNFYDASEIGYRQSSYFSVVVMGKAKIGSKS